MMHLSRIEKAKFYLKTRKCFRQSILYTEISKEKYVWSEWCLYIIKCGDDSFRQAVLEWIDKKKVTTFPIRNQYNKESILFHEILRRWDNDFITSLWVATHFWEGAIDREDTLFSFPTSISYKVWGYEWDKQIRWWEGRP
ncbi:MAG: hypothetical protein IJ716_06040 [Lachnospiraceae bacterium]|nr:hypothetical protein [Lachnospiraceae bacterium]